MNRGHIKITEAVYGKKCNGKGKMNVIKNVPYEKKTKLPKSKFTRKGYTFIGWNTKKNGKGVTYKNLSNVKNLTTKNGKAVTLYAMWKKK